MTDLRMRTIKSILALLAIATVLMALAVPAMADSAMHKDDGCKCGSGMDGCKCGSGMDGRMDDHMGHEMKNVLMTVTATGMAGGSATFDVTSIAMKGKEDKAAVFTFGTPLTGTYNASYDMGYISTANFLPSTAVMDTVSNSSIPVAGASALIGLEDIKPLVKEKGYYVFEFSKVMLYMPNGSAKAFHLKKPVRVTYEEDRKIIVIDAFPSFTKRMGRAFAAGASFPAGTAPVKLSDIMSDMMSERMSASAETIDYEEPAYQPPPA